MNRVICLMSPLAALPRFSHVIVADCPEVRINPFWRGISIIAMVRPPHCVAKTVLLATFMTGALGILGAIPLGSLGATTCGTMGGAGAGGYQARPPPNPGSPCGACGAGGGACGAGGGASFSSRSSFSSPSSSSLEARTRRPHPEPICFGMADRFAVLLRNEIRFYL